MKLFNLSNKLVTVQHRITRQEVINSKITKEKFEELIKAELYRQMAEYVMKYFKIVSTELDDQTIEFRGQGYVMNDRDMLNVILEVLQLDEEGRKMLEDSIELQLGIK